MCKIEAFLGWQSNGERRALDIVQQCFHFPGFWGKMSLKMDLAKVAWDRRAPKAIPRTGSDVQLQILSALLYVKDLYLITACL